MVSFAAATWVVMQHFSLLNSCFNLNHISLCSLTNDGYAHIILSKSQTLNKQKLWCTPDIKIKQSFAQIKHVRSENLCPKKFYKYNRHSSSRIEANNNCQTATVNFLLIGVKLAAVKTKGKECGSGVSSRFWEKHCVTTQVTAVKVDVVTSPVTFRVCRARFVEYWSTLTL